MTPRTKKQFEEIRSEKMHLILNTALKLFAENGYENTSINLIAKEANISKGLLYNYFKSKEDLLHQILVGGFEHFLLNIDSNTSKDANVSKEQMTAYIEDSFDYIKQNLSFFKLYFSILFQSNMFAKIFEEIIVMTQPVMMFFVCYYTGKGVKKPEIHAQYLFASMDGLMLYYLMDTENFPIDEIKEIIIDKL